MKRRWISIVTAIALVVAMIPFATLAAEPQAIAGALSGASEETEVSAVEQEVALSADSDTDAGQTEASQVTPEEEQPGDELQAADAQDTDAGQTEAPQVTSEEEQPGDELQATDARDTDAGQTEASQVTPEEEQPGAVPQAADAQATDAGQAGAPEQVQQEAQLMADQGQDPYEVSYSGPNQTVEIPFDQFGEALNGWDMVSAQVLDGQGKTLTQLKGKKDNIHHLVVLTMPYDLDLTAGTYDLRFLLRQSWSGEEAQLDGYATLTTDQDIHGVHLVNTVIRYDGTDQGTFTLNFRNGTGDNRIVSIDRVIFATRVEDGGSATGINLTQSSSGYTYDLDKGELCIPNAYFADRTLDPVVYFVKMNFTLANGQQITYTTLDITPDQPVPAEGFVNPGDEAWYFMYEPEPEPDVQPYDLSYPGPNKTVEIPFDQFGDRLNGMDMVSAQVLDDQGEPVARLEGKKDNFRSVLMLTMPYDLDLTAGTYDLRFLLCQSWSGETSQLDGYATLTLDQAIQGIHLINTELRYDGADEGSYVLRFQNGTGDNRITDISRIRFMTRMEDGSTQGFSLKAGTGSFTCDLDTGEITIPASSLARQDLDPVVYFGMMDFSLANGETITANSLNIVPDEAVLPGDFVNDGGQGWYLIPQTGVELSGTVKTPDQAGDVQLKLTRTGEREAAYEVTLSGQAGTTDYSIAQVEAGAYILTVSKEHCAARDYPITVGADPVEQDVELWLLGDVNGDGAVDTFDAAMTNACAQQIGALEAYARTCADVNQDGTVDTFDAARINAHAQKLQSLWD